MRRFDNAQNCASVICSACVCSTTTVLRPFLRDYPGEPVPEETLTHPPSWPSSNLYQLLPSTTIHSILLVQITCLAIFLHNLFTCLLWSTSWSGALHLIFHTCLHPMNQCLLFAAHAYTIATCFAVVSILYHLFLVFLSTPYLELLSFILTLHIHLTILISACWSATSFSFLTGQVSLLCNILISDIAIFVLKRDVKLQLTN